MTNSKKGLAYSYIKISANTRGLQLDYGTEALTLPSKTHQTPGAGLEAVSSCLICAAVIRTRS